jgi:hypothetical protein
VAGVIFLLQKGMGDRPRFIPMDLQLRGLCHPEISSPQIIQLL